MTPLRMLAITVATGRVGYVFLIGGKLEGWGMSRKGSRSPEQAAEVTKCWIARLRPVVVITEETNKYTRKGQKTQDLIEAIAAEAKHSDVLDVRISASREYQNKYEEAKALATEFPSLAPWVPRPRRIWDSEPRSTVYFEAMALALKVLRNPSQRLAAAME